MDPTATTPSPTPIPAVSANRSPSPFGYFKAIQTVLSVAILVATLFTLWTPASLFNNSLTEKMNLALAPGVVETVAVVATPTGMPTPLIGIVSGHWGNDSGAVCSDGLTEADVNLKIATLVMQNLTREGYQVDLLQEFDTRLLGYQAMLLLSIHNDSCDYINDEATGYKVSGAQSNLANEKTDRLTACLIDRYAASTGMVFHFNSITPDMTEYHAFSEISANTPAAIIETGFLNLDRTILTERTDQVASGITAGIICYIRNETITVQPTPTNP
jgi:N-acetylmuramoyl-L-alanine amidase